MIKTAITAKIIKNVVMWISSLDKVFSVISTVYISQNFCADQNAPPPPRPPPPPEPPPNPPPLKPPPLPEEEEFLELAIAIALLTALSTELTVVSKALVNVWRLCIL
jgi:hypothetical protein